MDYSEAKKEDAIKFLKSFSEIPAPDPGPQFPLRPAWPALEPEEVEGECLDMAKRYLCGKQCPGLLSYHMAAEACSRLKATSLDRFKRSSAPDTPTEGETENGGSDKEVGLNASLIAQELAVILHELGKEWSNEFPPLKCPVDKKDLSMFGMKNRRRKMEDRYAICLDLNSLYQLQDMPAQSYYAVFDGHVGVEAAVYASLHMLPNIVRHPSFTDDLPTAIKGGIKKTDEMFCKKGIQSGTTVVAVFLRGDKLYASWLGDSQALLVRKGKPTQLVKPHKPDREDEQQRIEEAGGVVIWMGAWRVNGNLSVSRAIGDAKWKHLVVGDADVDTYDVDGTEDYLVVACDGVWDVLNGEEVAECVSKHLAQPEGSKQSVAKTIAEFARAEGSSDNITVIVAFFNKTGGIVTLSSAQDTVETTPTNEAASSSEHRAGNGEAESVGDSTT